MKTIYIKHDLINNSGSICRTTKFQLCMKRGDCHESKYINNITIAFIVFVLLISKDGCCFWRFFQNNMFFKIIFVQNVKND